MEPTNHRQNFKLQTMRSKIKISIYTTQKEPKPDTIRLSASGSTNASQQQIVSSPFAGQNPELSFSSFLGQSQPFLKNVFEQKYQILQKLGEGANGVVRKCINKSTGQIFAVKIGKMQQQHFIGLERIVIMMRKIKHQNILRIKELYRDQKRSKYYHVIQYLPFPSLKQLMNHNYQFTPRIIKIIMKQLFSALSHFHKYYIAHRDIKTSNILFDPEKEHLYLIDLGIITKTVHRGKRRNLWSNNGTSEYKAPEMLLGSSYSENVDMWAAGVVLFELIEGRTPFKEESHFDMIQRITQIKYQFNQQLWKTMPLAKKLVSMLLKPKLQRLNARQASKAPWFQQIESDGKVSKKQIMEIKSANSWQRCKKPDFEYNSLLILNGNNKKESFNELDYQGLDVCNPYNLRMSCYELADLTLSQIIENKQDKMIINNNS